MKDYAFSLFAVVSILAFIGGCASTANIQKTSEMIEPALISDTALKPYQDPLLANIADLSDQQKLFHAEKHTVAGDIKTSNKILNSIETQNLSNKDFIEYSLLAAENYWAIFQIQPAAEQLNNTRFKSLLGRQNKELKQRILNFRADIAFASGDYYQGLEDLIKLAKLAKRKTPTREIHDRIWSVTSRMPFHQLDPTKVKSVVLSGWLELAAQSRRYQSHPDEQSFILRQWRRNWKSHPAAKVPPSFFSGSTFWNSNPAQIALLLPLQDDYQRPSQTLIDGFMSAYYQTMNLDSKKTLELPELRIYDTSDMPIKEVYNRAIDDGMDMVIGPMRQSAVRELSLVGDLPVPTLTLNRIDSIAANNIENLFQFGLSTVDELTQIADRAWKKNFKNILMIAPENSWGKRSLKFFNQYWVSKGGNLTENVLYPLTVNDFTKLLKKPLQIDLSEQRGLAIKRYINSRVNYSSRRRQDIDLVVMLGYPLKARQIKPALDFLYASNIPVIGTSHIYNGIEQVGLDRDLSGVEFSSMPWTLSGQLVQELAPDEQLHTAYRQLFSLGYDSFLIARNLSTIEESQGIPIFGATGLLSFSNGIITREQKWAKFQGGKAIEIH